MRPPGHHHTLLSDEDEKEESVKAKWEQLQYFETKGGDPITARHETVKVDASLSSLTSSGSGSQSDSIATGSSSFKSGAKAKWKQMKKGSIKKLTSLTNRLNLGKRSTPNEGVPSNEYVSTAPDGRLSGVLPKIQASKSMQNLENITRGSYYNFRGATANLKEKCNSIAELRQNQPKTQYEEMWDEDSDGNEDIDRKQRVILQRIGLH